MTEAALRSSLRLAASDVVYDARGNVTKLGGMAFSYDGRNAHVGTTYADGSAVSIVRDAGLARTFGLPDGVMSTVTGAATELSYPSLLGHTLTAGDGSTTASGVWLFDPFGQRVPTTRLVATEQECGHGWPDRFRVRCS